MVVALIIVGVTKSEFEGKSGSGAVSAPTRCPHTLPHPGHLLTRLISIRAFLKLFLMDCLNSSRTGRKKVRCN